MKKSILLMMALIMTHSVLASEPVVPPSEKAMTTQQDENQAITLTNQLKLIPKNQHEEDKQLPYVIDVSYPQIEGKELSAEAKAFNHLIVETVTQEVSQFKKYVKEDMPHMKSLPESVKQNTFQMDYNLDVVKSNDTLLSVRLITTGFQAGRAHPYHTNHVINFNLTTGKVLSLGALFKPHSHYLKVLSTYSEKILNTKLEDKFMIKDGTKPIEKNYKNWNIDGESLVITFDEYQVAPYVYGAQEVSIPYVELKSILSPASPIYSCAQRPGSCSAK